MKITKISARKDDAGWHGAGWGCPDGHVYIFEVGNDSGFFRNASFVGDRDGVELADVVAGLRGLADALERARADVPAGRDNP